jgi:UDP-N-acetylmuramoylalanine--D-glutamate ligase
MKIAIVGYGIEGRSNYSYFMSRGDVTIVDENSQLEGIQSGAKTLLGKGVFKRLEDFDLVVRTAGVAPYKIETKGKIWSATNEFFARCPAPIIGVTGSKGKGTTCSFIKSILHEAGMTVHLIGNIGVPALDVLDDIASDKEVVVYELSSFQLWDVKRSPQVAVLLKIEPDHLDVHIDFEEYVSAKSNITRYQTSQDTIIYDISNKYTHTIAQASLAQRVPYQSQESAHVSNGMFWYGEQKLCSIETMHLPGLHNQDNACAAIDAAWIFTQDKDAIRRGLSAFTGLPHRLKFVRNVNDVDYYDDSLATTPGSAIAAMKAFTQPKIMIFGGSSKGGDFNSVAETAAKSNVKAAIVIGGEADKISTLLETCGINVINLGTTMTMDEIVRVAQEQTIAGDVVILSPAYASFGMFKDYSDRGNRFIAAVNSL